MIRQLLLLASVAVLSAQSPSTFTTTGNLITAEGSPFATLLSNGKILITGNSTELYDPVSGSFSPTTLAERPPLEGNWYDTGSTLRVRMPSVRLDRLAKLAFDQIRQASTTTPAVLIRQLDCTKSHTQGPILKLRAAPLNLG